MKSKLIHSVRASAPLVVSMLFVSVSAFAGTSPVGRWLTDLRAEATSIWAVAGAVIGLVIGILGLKFGGRDAKGGFATTLVLSFLLLSVEGVVAYLQSE